MRLKVRVRFADGEECFMILRHVPRVGDWVRASGSGELAEVIALVETIAE